MCLYTSEESPLCAKEDIKVFKVLTRANHGPCAIRYTYQHGRNVPLTEDILAHLNIVAQYPPQPNQLRSIGRGYLHAWQFRSDALDMAANYQDYEGELRVVEMYIPKGASYYLGSEGDIAASELVWHGCAPEYETKELLNKENE